jgi:hypothetical protein
LVKRLVTNLEQYTVHCTEEHLSGKAPRRGEAGMRLDVLVPLGPESTEAEDKREIGAVVARASPAGGLTVEFGPADGAPILRLGLSKAETQRLCITLEAIINGRDEEIMITED